MAMTRDDWMLLRAVADYRLLTIEQIMQLDPRSEQVVRRRLRAFEKDGLLHVASHQLGQKRGRPQRVMQITPIGLQRLRQSASSPDAQCRLPDTLKPIRHIEHHLAINLVRLCVGRAPRSGSAQGLQSQFLSPDSPLTPAYPDGGRITSERLHTDRGVIAFEPDGVFAIAHGDCERPLLFFLEVDNATEALASSKRHPRDLRQKIENYRQYLRSGGYKRYETVFEARSLAGGESHRARCLEFRGFRLLVVTTSEHRFSAVCRLVHAMAPSDFIWVTSCSQVTENGLWAPIWSRGGNLQRPHESILGRLAPSHE